jgi:hypothetical protein
MKKLRIAEVRLRIDRLTVRRASCHFEIDCRTKELDTARNMQEHVKSMASRL